MRSRPYTAEVRSTRPRPRAPRAADDVDVGLWRGLVAVAAGLGAGVLQLRLVADLVVGFLRVHVDGDPRDLHSFPTRRSSDLRSAIRKLAQAELEPELRGSGRAV